MKENQSLEDVDETLGPWLTVIGTLVMFWSPIERSIDQCVHFLHKANGSPKKKKPTRLTGKLELISNNMQALVIGQVDLEKLIQATKVTVQIRDVCVHGSLKEYDEQKLVIDKIKGGHADHLLEDFTIDRNRLECSAKSLTELAQAWGALSTRLHEALTKPQI